MKLPQLPMWIILGIALFGGVWFLSWHRWANDPDDEAWLDPGQPPAQVMLPLVPAAHGTGSPMSCNTGFRSRCYPDVLATAKQVIAEAMDGD